jgi:hypothetical protein
MSERWLWTQKEDIGPSPRWGAAMRIRLLASEWCSTVARTRMSALVSTTRGSGMGVPGPRLPTWGRPDAGYLAWPATTLASGSSCSVALCGGPKVTRPMATLGNGTELNGPRWPT